MDYKGKVCKGAYALGSACGKCEKCDHERATYEARKSVQDALNTPPASLTKIRELTKQRDELAAKVEELENSLIYERQEYARLKAERDQALAASAAREIAMRDRAAEVVRKHLGPNPFCQEEIRALPISPDGQQALDNERDELKARIKWLRGSLVFVNKKLKEKSQ